MRRGILFMLNIAIFRYGDGFSHRHTDNVGYLKSPPNLQTKTPSKIKGLSLPRLRLKLLQPRLP